MQNCLDCLTWTSTNCIKTEEELSFDYGTFNDLIKQLDNKDVEQDKILKNKIDGKGIPEKEYVTEYIQDIINKLDVIDKKVNSNSPSQTFTIQSELTGGNQKTLLQLLTILFKTVDSINKKLDNNSSSNLYLPNV